jgi:PPM family protein phosphatase
MTTCEKKGNAAVAWMKGTKHKFYEDRYRMLSKEIPLVESRHRGELFAVFDGIGSAPRRREAAQEMCNYLLRFFSMSDEHESSWEGLRRLLMEANQCIFDWGFMPGTERPAGGCAGTVIWIQGEALFVFHAGDTAGVLIRDDTTTRLNRLHETNGGIYRYFGLGPSLQIDVQQFSLEEGDRILLVSDGVTKAFHPEEAASVINQFDDKGRAVTELVQRSMRRGSTDDITALLVEIEEL